MSPPKANRNIASSTRNDERAALTNSAVALASLFAPLDQLLRVGGDERLALMGQSGLNNYGCRPAPRPEAISFSTSTASSISGQAYRRARAAQERLVEQAAVNGLLESFDSHVERTRRTLRQHLALEATGVEIVFAPSGTDAQLQAIPLAGQLLGSAFTTIVTGSDQTGSGTTHTAGARHFGSITARGKSVQKGAPIYGDGIANIEIPFAGPGETFRSAIEMDRMVWEAVAAEIANGRNVVLQTINGSKFGWSAPSDDCVARIAATWPGRVQIVVDACQMRLSRVRLSEHLVRNHLVLLTGSKFFSGPPFSGGLLVPKLLSQKLSRLRHVPNGLFDYAGQSDLPIEWRSLRDKLALEPNFGQWLRWEAALEEIRSYYRLPLSFRKSVLAGLAEAIPRMIGSLPGLELLAAPAGLWLERESDEEFASPTIFPFVIRNAEGFVGADAMSEIYRALNRDISAELAFDVDPHELLIAKKPCLIGQPVNVNLNGGSTSAALRIAIGSRNLLDTWSRGAGAAERSVQRIMADVAIVLGKIDLILRSREHKQSVAQSALHRTMEIPNGQ